MRGDERDRKPVLLPVRKS